MAWNEKHEQFPHEACLWSKRQGDENNQRTHQSQQPLTRSSQCAPKNSPVSLTARRPEIHRGMVGDEWVDGQLIEQKWSLGLFSSRE